MVSLFWFFCYFVTLEFLVFADHYWLLHVWLWGKKNLKHDEHHIYEKSDEMNPWTGYAFSAIDGFSQGLPIFLCTLLYPVPSSFLLALETTIGIVFSVFFCDICVCFVCVCLCVCLNDMQSN